MLSLKLRHRVCVVHVEGEEPRVWGEVNEEVVGPMDSQPGPRGPRPSLGPCWLAVGRSVQREASAARAASASPAGCNQEAVGKGISGVARTPAST